MWQTIESDPGLFTELVEQWGVPNVEFNELYAIDREGLAAIDSDELYGIIFLFNHTADTSSSKDKISPASSAKFAPDAPVYFARQVVEDSCATQALVSLVFNQPQLDLGSELSDFREFSSALDPEMRGETIASSEFLRQKHNAMSKPVSFIDESAPQRNQRSAAYHYVAYVRGPDNHVYELDGLKPAPVDHGNISSTFGDKLSHILQDRIKSFEDSELGFSVLAATNDLRRNSSQPQGWSIEQEAKRQRWYRENQLRRQPYTALAIELLKQLA